MNLKFTRKEVVDDFLIWFEFVQSDRTSNRICVIFDKISKDLTIDFYENETKKLKTYPASRVYILCDIWMDYFYTNKIDWIEECFVNTIISNWKICKKPEIMGLIKEQKVRSCLNLFKHHDSISSIFKG